MIRWTLCFLAALAAFIPGAAQAAAEPREMLLCDFEKRAGGIGLGTEFPGAQGDFQVVKESAHTGTAGGRLTFDLTRGAYVCWGLNLSPALKEGARMVSVWVRTDAPGRRIHLKTRDVTGQEHMRVNDTVPGNQWTRLRFDLEKMNAHWGGANDGKIHWPITYVQIGVEPKGSPKTGVLEMDDLTVTTTASRAEAPGVQVKLEAPRFGNLFGAGEQIRWTLTAQDTERREKQELTGSYRVQDWQDREVAKGAMRLAVGEPAAVALALPKLPAGAYRLAVELSNPKDAEETVRAEAWFGVLGGPNPKPCGWIGTGLHGGHGWAHGDLRFLDILQAAGIGVVRDEFGWSGIEKQKGEYATSPRVEAFVNALKERDIRLNLILTYGNGIYENPLDPDAYSRWAAWMAKHFDGRINDFEIWNEAANFHFRKQYGGGHGGNAPWITKFVELTRKASAAIREARPDATIVVCAEDGWANLQSMIRQGIGQGADVISIHPYCHGQPRPEREFFLKDSGRALRSLSKENGGPQRVVITEAGWTTYQGEMEYLAIAGGYPRSSYTHQAQYLVRMYLTALAAGADYAIQYDFKNDGPRRNYTEHNFGLVHEDYSPKPSLMAVAALTRLAGQGKFVCDAAPDPSVARAYVLDVAGKPVVAAYAMEGEATLKLPVGRNRVEVADLMGNRRPMEAPGGVVTLKLTETPVYVLGGTMESLARRVRVEVDDTELTVAAGDTVATTLHLENGARQGARPTVSWQAPQAVKVSLGETGKSLSAIAPGESLAVPVQVQVGAGQREAFDLLLKGSLGAQAFERRVRVRVKAPLSCRVGPAAATGATWAGSAFLTNESARPLSLEAQVTNAAASGLRAAPLKTRLEPGRTAELRYSLERWPEGPLTLQVTARTGDGWESAHTGAVHPATIPALAAAPVVDGDLSDWRGGCRFHLADASQFARLNDAWRGPEDLSAVVHLGWSAAGLCVGVAVRDDVFFQNRSNSEIWQGDSVQLALAPAEHGLTSGTRFLEMGLARTPEGDRCISYGDLVGPEVAKKNPVRFASRKGEGTLTYEAIIPWALLPGVSPREGTALGFALVLNENDGKGRRGWMELFGGIGWSKNPAHFGRMTLGGE